MLNKVLIIGNLGRDPEIRHTQSGDTVCNLSVATSESWRDKNSGEKREKTEWHRVSIFGKTAEFAEKYLRKGSKVYIEGQLQTRKWTDQSGAEKYATEIVISGFKGALQALDRPAGNDGGDGEDGAQNAATGQETASDGAPDDPLPF